MAVVYADYSRDRIGWFFGLTGAQLATLALSSLPVFWALRAQAWTSALLFTGLWAVVAVVTTVSVRGRSALGWLVATTLFAVAGVAGWSRFRSRAATGRAGPLHEPDLPGVLAGVQIHDGPPTGPHARRVALIQHHVSRCWAITAAVTHPGVGMADASERARQGRGLGELLDLAARTEMIDELIVVVRTVSEDGAEREQWIRRHRRTARTGGSELARNVNDDLHEHQARAAVRTEAFVTMVVAESRIARTARESGGGLAGRARVLHGLAGEVEAGLRGAMAMPDVCWLTSQELAAAVRTGFAPGDRAGIIDALAAAEHDPAVAAEVPWALAGPSGADTAARHYSHDAWNSISATLRLPAKGAVLGALAPVLVPGEPGERRSLAVCFPILRQRVADRRAGNAEFAADLGAHLRTKAGVKQRAQQRADEAKATGMDAKLAGGHAMTRPYAVCTVTAPKTARIGEYGRRLDAAVRRAGFAPLRLDLSGDTGFAASTLPLGVGLTRRGDT